MKVKESTYVKYYAIVEKHIKPSLGRCKISKLSDSHIENFTQELMTEAELSPKTIKDILVVLKSVLRYAEVQQNEPIPKINITYPREKKKEIRILSKEEQAVFIRYLMSDDDPCKFGTLFALLTGLRIGEICALRWESISLRDGTVSVGATMQRLKDLAPERTKKTKILISDPKSDTSARVIPLSNFALELCRKNKPIYEGAFVLTGVPDKYVEPRTLQYKMERYVSDCGLDDVHFHTLRHTFATRCVEGGFEIKSLSEILGHSAPQITLNRYVHSSMELKRENMNKVVMFAM